MILVCNTPAILSFDPFPNYRPTSIDSVERQKREIVEDNQQDDDESNERLSEKDNIELETIINNNNSKNYNNISNNVSDTNSSNTEDSLINIKSLSMNDKSEKIDSLINKYLYNSADTNNNVPSNDINIYI